MSKKQKRKVSRGTGPARTTSMQTAVEEYTAPSAPTPVINRNLTSRFATDFNPDHSATLKDLKRIGILAGTFISLLVVLSFFLN